MRAADGLWAVGDVTGAGAFTHLAVCQARIAADDILGLPGFRSGSDAKALFASSSTLLAVPLFLAALFAVRARRRCALLTRYLWLACAALICWNLVPRARRQQNVS